MGGMPPFEVKKDLHHRTAYISRRLEIIGKDIQNERIQRHGIPEKEAFFKGYKGQGAL